MSKLTSLVLAVSLVLGAGKTAGRVEHPLDYSRSLEAKRELVATKDLSETEYWGNYWNSVPKETHKYSVWYTIG